MKNYEELLLWTREAQERSCQVARCFQQRGYKKGDVVALGTLILGGGGGGARCVQQRGYKKRDMV